MNNLQNVNISFNTNLKNHWNIKTDGLFMSHIVEIMNRDKYPLKAIDSIIDNSLKIISQMPNPNNENSGSKNGLAIGKIQSGKTSNFISTVAMAFDNGYKVCIILGGNKKNLVYQNSKRIKESLNSTEDWKKRVIILDTVEDSISLEKIMSFLNRDKKVIIISLKHQDHIKNISQMFSSEAIQKVPTFIVDDEGDQAGLNTKRYSKKVKNDMSAIYKEIIELKGKFKLCAFLSVTATPYAQILISIDDHLSPDFYHLIYPGEGYCGLSEFYGDSDNNHTIIIDDDIQENFYKKNGNTQTIWDALSVFFVSNGIRKSRGDNGDHSLLFHTSHSVNHHKILGEKIDGILKHLNTIANSEHDDISHLSIDKNFQKAYQMYINDGIKVPEYNELKKFIFDSILECPPVHILNSDAKNKKENNSSHFSTNIFLGGNKIERGITVKGLATTYIIRTSKSKSNMDTVEQRARWLGYKKEYIDICKVFTTNKIMNSFKNIYASEEYLWTELQDAKNKNISFKDFELKVKNKSPETMNHTGRNRARVEPISSKKGNFEVIQNKVILDKNISIFNINILENIKNNKKNLLTVKEFTIHQKHLVLENLDFDYLNSELFSKYKYDEESNLQKKYFDNLKLLFNDQKDKFKLDLVWVRYEEKEERSMTENGKIITYLLQGVTPGNNSKNHYIGDRNIPYYINKNNIHIQIHMVKPTESNNVDYYSPFLAVYVPKNYRINQKDNDLFIRSDEI